MNTPGITALRAANALCGKAHSEAEMATAIQAVIDLEVSRVNLPGYERRRLFRVEMYILVDQFGGATVDALADEHQSSVPLVREFCKRTEEHIRPWYRKAFKITAKSYCGLTGNQIENPNAEHIAAYMWTQERPEGKAFDLERGRTRICDHLNQLIKYAKAWPF